ncbi:MAG: hypothetical protein K0S51_1294 [Bacillales bacterium]|jgi:UDP-D-galactose:(glucosyl)LPS alpha-1,6-D-galactosyltransferase|nr:hypothetical protein [Bacillales bacterium]
MKVIILSPRRIGIGGFETVAQTIMTNIKKPVEMKLIILNGSEHVEWLENLDHEFVESKYKNKHIRLFFNLFKLIKKLMSEKPDIILGLCPYTIFMAKVSSLFIKNKVSVGLWLHGSFKIWKNKRFFKLADFYLAVCEEIADDIKAFIPNKKNHVYTVYNPVKVANTIIQEPEVPTFVYLGRLEFGYGKRVDDFINALSKLNGSYRAEIYGTGECLNDLKQLSHNLGISDKVVFHGWVNDPWLKINKASSLVLTSDTEGFGMVLVEALVRGLPCISSDCSAGPKEIIEHGSTGFLFPVGEINKLAEYMQLFIDKTDYLKDKSYLINSASKFREENIIENITNALNQEYKAKP